MLATPAFADGLDDNIKSLRSSDNYKTRLAATLALAKSTEARAHEALMVALQSDKDSTVRRVAAIALGRAGDGASEAMLKRLRAALTTASQADKDQRVREGAIAALANMPVPAVATVKTTTAGATKPPAKMPAVFVQIERAVDATKKASQATDLMTKQVRKTVEDAGFVTMWPNGAPTKAELAKQGTQGFVVISTIKKIDIKKKRDKSEIGCTLAIRISPWSGKDGSEKWEANRSAAASGSAKTSTSSDAADIKTGVSDCVEALTEDLMRKQAAPFLKKIAST
jgi:hypothetical protein